eukprot:879265_1
MALSWSNIAFITYFALNLVLIIVITVKARSESRSSHSSNDLRHLMKNLYRSSNDRDDMIRNLRKSNNLQLHGAKHRAVLYGEDRKETETNDKDHKETDTSNPKSPDTTPRAIDHDEDRKETETNDDEDHKETDTSNPQSPDTTPRAIDEDRKVAAFAAFKKEKLALTEIDDEHHHLNPKELVKVVWRQRGIYAPLLVHFYDTSTDIGVIVEWWVIAHDGDDPINDAVNMTILIWLSIGFMVLYRLTTIAVLIYMECTEDIEIAKENDDEDSGDENDSLWVDIFLSLFDLYIIKAIYKSMKKKDTEAGPRQKLLQLLESISESLPQMVLQSVFLIKTQTTDSSSAGIVALSLAASLLSVTNKYVWFDADSVMQFARSLQFKKKFGSCVSYAYVIRIIWRFSLISVRFIMFSMMWCVIGGMYWFIFAVISYTIWVSYFYIIRSRENDDSVKDEEIGDNDDNPYRPLVYALIAFVSYLLSRDNAHLLFFVHFIDTTLPMVFITWFVFSPVTCWRCTDPSERTIDNHLIKLYLICGWSFFGLQVILFPLVRCMIRDGAKEDDVFVQVVFAVTSDLRKQEIDRKYVTGFIKVLKNVTNIHSIMVFDCGEEDVLIKPTKKDLRCRRQDSDNDDEWEHGMPESKRNGQIFNRAWMELENSGYTVNAYCSEKKKYMYLTIGGAVKIPDSDGGDMLYAVDLSPIIFNNAQSPMIGFFPETAVNKPFPLVCNIFDYGDDDYNGTFGCLNYFDPSLEFIDVSVLPDLVSHIPQKPGEMHMEFD